MIKDTISTINKDDALIERISQLPETPQEKRAQLYEDLIVSTIDTEKDSR